MGVTLYESDFNADGIAVINYNQRGFNGIDNALVHGNVTFEKMPGNPEYAQVKYVKKYGCRCGMYDFEIHNRSGMKTFIRNMATKIGAIVAGKGQSYQINFIGVNTINYIKLIPVTNILRYAY